MDHYTNSQGFLRNGSIVEREENEELNGRVISMKEMESQVKSISVKNNHSGEGDKERSYFLQPRLLLFFEFPSE